MKRKILLRSARETKMFAKRFAANILTHANRRKGAVVIGLVGDLGAGKTTFVQGFGKAFGVKQRMVSPTFLIFRSYKLQVTSYKFARLYHVDLYRIHSPRELETLNFRHILRDPKNIVLIEWADRIKKTLPKGTIWVTLGHRRKEHERFASIR